MNKMSHDLLKIFELTQEQLENRLKFYDPISTEPAIITGENIY